MRGYRNLVFFTMVLTFFLIMFGAFVRLADAGLGCPDWPGCYGQLSPIQAKADISAAVQEQGGEHGPVSMRKAWKEMGHRYVATALGLLILIIAAIAINKRQQLKQSPILPIVLVGVVILQGLFGMWTVTLLLKPAIVTGHLIGGLLTFSLLVWLWQRQVRLGRYIDAEPVAALKKPAILAMVLLSAQIILGGWTSTNYAALACQDLPTCQGKWWPTMDFEHAFDIVRELGKTEDGGNLPFQSLTAIHFLHRLGAMVVGTYMLWFGVKVARTPGVAHLGVLLLLGLAAQICLGISNVLFSLPIGVATAHTGGAAVLLALLVVLNFRAHRARYQV
jgi:heme a synthase